MAKQTSRRGQRQMYALFTVKRDASFENLLTVASNRSELKIAAERDNGEPVKFGKAPPADKRGKLPLFVTDDAQCAAVKYDVVDANGKPTGKVVNRVRYVIASVARITDDEPTEVCVVDDDEAIAAANAAKVNETVANIVANNKAGK